MHLSSKQGSTCLFLWIVRPLAERSALVQEASLIKWRRNLFLMRNWRQEVCETVDSFMSEGFLSPSYPFQITLSCQPVQCLRLLRSTMQQPELKSRMSAPIWPSYIQSIFCLGLLFWLTMHRQLARQCHYNQALDCTPEVLAEQACQSAWQA